MSLDLDWLPENPDWAADLRSLRHVAAETAWPHLVRLARQQIDLTKTEQLTRATRRLCGLSAPAAISAPPIRLALLGSATVEHLLPGLVVAGIRRNLWIETFTAGYGQYANELQNPGSDLYRFAPNTILITLDARHAIGNAAAEETADGAEAVLKRRVEALAASWDRALATGAQVIQQSLLPVFPGLIGGNEHRLAWSPRRLVAQMNALIRERADRSGVDVLDLSEAVERSGLHSWYDPGLWHRSKQEIHPLAGPLYGDRAVRLIAARLGRSAKCLVLDLDNTLWGGIIGDDGLQGIALGQGSAVGEAHLAVQAYARDLSRRGIILAVCSKNDRQNAIEPFERHPEMVLRTKDIACFVANWVDKATNIRAIASRLNIGLDALVFLDDNPFERNIVRCELPMVEVPEVGDDAATYVDTIARAGYFEAISTTAEDAKRTEQYQAKARLEEAMSAATDVSGYLRSLEMQLTWSPFDAVGLGRVVQLINKSNQYNLTTRRYTMAQAEQLMDERSALTFQMRLSDMLGDNGMISVIVARSDDEDVFEIDTWLMSCRVLGRGVERMAMNILADHARSRGATRIVGRYIPTAKNGMVADHYEKLGFRKTDDENSVTVWSCDLEAYRPLETFITASRAH